MVLVSVLLCVFSTFARLRTFALRVLAFFAGQITYAWRFGVFQGSPFRYFPAAASKLQVDVDGVYSQYHLENFFNHANHFACDNVKIRIGTEKVRYGFQVGVWSNRIFSFCSQGPEKDVMFRIGRRWRCQSPCCGHDTDVNVLRGSAAPWGCRGGVWSQGVVRGVRGSGVGEDVNAVARCISSVSRCGEHRIAMGLQWFSARRRCFGDAAGCTDPATAINGFTPVLSLLPATQQMEGENRIATDR